VTIAITIRTSAAVVFAADSKLSTSGLGGYQENGEPIWLDQSYDNAFKVAHDQNRLLMAMAVGHANVGRIGANDFISAYKFPHRQSLQSQNKEIEKLGSAVAAELSSYWGNTKVAPDQWRAPRLIISAAAPDNVTPRIWKGTFKHPNYEFAECLITPGIDTDGTFNEVDSLLYGINWSFWAEIRRQWNISKEKGSETLANSKVLMPINRLNFYTMPTQDAIDLAVFLAEVQVQMDRFLPGTAVCGGPIDVMVLQMTPKPSIIEYLGKTLHHPHVRS
jgi:hypothetical protein